MIKSCVADNTPLLKCSPLLSQYVFRNVMALNISEGHSPPRASDFHLGSLSLIIEVQYKFNCFI